MSKKSHSKDLTKGSIPRTIAILATPMLLSSILQMSYNLTDMLWIAQINSDAVSAVGTAGFFIWLAFTFTQLVTIGTQAKSSQLTGNKQYEEAKKYQQSGLQLSFILGILYSLIMFIFAKQLIDFFKINNEIINNDATNYLKVVSIYLPCMFLNFTFANIYNSKGLSDVPFKFILVSTIMNIVLDPIFIFILDLGVVGAGLATVISNISLTILYLTYTLKHFDIIDKDLFKKYNINYMKEIVSIGIPPATFSIILCVTSMYITRMVSAFGDNAIAIQRVGSQIEGISWGVAGSLSGATASFVGQNYGANEPERVKKGVRVSMLMSGSIGVLATLMFIFIPHVLLYPFFYKEPELIAMGITYLNILSLCQMFRSIEMTATGAFNGLGKTKPPAFIGVFFNVVRIPIIYYVSKTMLGLNGVWLAISILFVLRGIIIFLSYLMYEKKILTR